MKPILALLLSIFALSASWPAYAVEISIIKVAVGGTQINVCFYKPDGPGPFPLLVMSHGSPRKAEDRAHDGDKNCYASPTATANCRTAGLNSYRGYW